MVGFGFKLTQLQDLPFAHKAAACAKSYLESAAVQESPRRGSLCTSTSSDYPQEVPEVFPQGGWVIC